MSHALDILRLQIARTSAQRAALRLRAAQTIDRLAVPRLADDARDFVAHMASETSQQVRAHPFTATGVVAATGIALFHRPLGRIVDRWLDRLDPTTEQLAPIIEDEDADPVRDS